jgi:superfamily II DNA or RNA helicase
MSKIVLKIHNSSTFVEGNIPPEVYKELRKQMSFIKKNYQFALKKRKGWDGRVSVLHYNKKSCKCFTKKTGMHFPTGLLSLAREVFSIYDIEYELIDNRTKPPKNKQYRLSDAFPARDYQYKTIEKSCKRGRGIIQSATGSGKTFMAAGIIAELSVSPVIFYVPSKDLLRQAKDEFEKFIKDSGSNLEVGVIGAGKCDIKDVNVMTVQTAIRSLDLKYKKADDEDSTEKDKLSAENKEKIKELIQNAKLVIADETQHWAADTCQVISDASENAYYKFGLSATPWRDDGDDILIDSCFGKSIAKISASLLIKKNHLVKPKIYFVSMNNMRGIKLNSYPEIYKAAIVENELRNIYIKNLCDSFYKQGRNILVLIRQIEHGNILESMIDNSVFLHGSKKNKEREDHFDLIRADHKIITIASSIFDEGIDLKALDTLILAGSGKCVHGSTKINTNNKNISNFDDIKFLVKKHYNIKSLEQNSFYDIDNLNLEVDSTFGKTKVLKFYYDGVREVYKISSKNYELIATANHRLRVMTSDNRVKYKKVKDITTEDKLMVKTNNSCFSFFNLSLKYIIDTILRENFKFEQVTNIDYMGKDEVYDITTEKGNYVASGIICHNSSTRALQRIGRVIRPYTYPDGSVKEEAIVIDFDDKCKYLQSHSNARRKIYSTEEEFEVLDLKS